MKSRLLLFLFFPLILSCASAPKHTIDSLTPVVTDGTMAVLTMGSSDIIVTDILRLEMFRKIKTDPRCNIKLVERTQIDKIFEQFELQNSGAISSEQAIEFGKMLQVDYAVIGTFKGNINKDIVNVAISARLVDVKTSEILSITNLADFFTDKEWETGIKYEAMIKQAANELLYGTDAHIEIGQSSRKPTILSYATALILAGAMVYLVTNTN